MKAKLHLLIVTLFVAAIDAGLGQPMLQFATNTYTVVENAASVTLSVWRLNDTNAAVTVDYATTNSTATADLDYTAANGTLTFLAGEISQPWRSLCSQPASRAPAPRVPRTRAAVPAIVRAPGTPSNRAARWRR